MDLKQIEQNFYYDKNDLGANVSQDGTCFKIWSPSAEEITLNFYKSSFEGDCFKTIALERLDKGVWCFKTEENLDETYYDYTIKRNNEYIKTADPYAKACGLNGIRSMVVDLKTTNPCGFENDKAPKKQNEDIIYEIHIKDFSHDESGGFPEEYRGKFKALCFDNTTLFGRGIAKTGLGYLKELGVNYIQLMPVYDFGSVDELDNSQFNWGYDPVNYNVPEGSYSTDPANGKTRIRELKELIQSLHKNGFRVIMDVVYNHTYSTDSWLELSMPNYYYRKFKNGEFSNGSGCGNDIASERKMCADYILNSIMYWAEEYHMDGFRFDLMGLLDVRLMNRIRKALDKKFGKGEKLVFGEPWSADKTATKRTLANKANIKKLDQNIGAFCDDVRDSIKGSVMSDDAVGFVNGGTGFEESIIKSISGWCGDVYLSPTQTINYVSCHDDMTLFDKLVKTIDKAENYEAPSSQVLSANKLSASIYTMCQGRLFLLSGEEFARTKLGINNTYNKPISINRLDWKRAYDNKELVDYYAGLFALRKKINCLCDKNKSVNIKSSKIIAPSCTCITLDNSGGIWNEIMLVYNASCKQIDVKLNENWQVLADSESSFKWQIEKTTNCEKVLPVSALILGKKG